MRRLECLHFQFPMAAKTLQLQWTDQPQLIIATSIIVFNLCRLFMWFWMMSTFVMIGLLTNFISWNSSTSNRSSIANHGHRSTDSHYMHGFEKLSQFNENEHENETEWHEMGIFSEKFEPIISTCKPRLEWWRSQPWWLHNKSQSGQLYIEKECWLRSRPEWLKSKFNIANENNKFWDLQPKQSTYNAC